MMFPAGSGAPVFVGPMDGFTEGLAGAWLPFRAFSDYTGAGFTIRDTVGDAEQEVGFDAVTGSLAGYAVGGSQALRRWYDQSGNGAMLSQALASAQPLLVTGELAEAVARFDGVNDTIAGTITKTVAMTVYLVARKITTSNGANARLLQFTDGVNCDTFYEPSGNRWRYYATNPNVVDDVGTEATTWSVLTHRYNAEVCEAFQEGGLVATFGSGGYDDEPEFHLGSWSGSGFFCQADVAGLLIYNVAHDDTTRQAIEAILMGRFGL